MIIYYDTFCNILLFMLQYLYNYAMNDKEY